MLCKYTGITQLIYAKKSRTQRCEKLTPWLPCSSIEDPCSYTFGSAWHVEHCEHYTSCKFSHRVGVPQPRGILPWLADLLPLFNRRGIPPPPWGASRPSWSWVVYASMDVFTCGWNGYLASTMIRLVSCFQEAHHRSLSIPGLLGTKPTWWSD